MHYWQSGFEYHMYILLVPHCLLYWAESQVMTILASVFSVFNTVSNSVWSNAHLCAGVTPRWSWSTSTKYGSSWRRACLLVCWENTAVESQNILVLMWVKRATRKICLSDCFEFFFNISNMKNVERSKSGSPHGTEQQ